MGILRRAMQNAGDVARREVFDRIEGRPTLKIAGPTGGPIETVTYDLKKLSAEKIKTISRDTCRSRRSSDGSLNVNGFGFQVC